MKNYSAHEIRSPAIGQRIQAVRNDAESGYVVIELDSGDELWVAACYEEAYHVITADRSVACPRPARSP